MKTGSFDVSDFALATAAPQVVPFLLSAALAESQWGVLIAETDGTIRYANPRLSEITGYDESELLGNNPRMLQSGLTSRETYQEMWHTLSCGRPWRGTLRNKRKSGELYWESLTVIPVKDARGGISNFVGIVEDVTRLQLCAAEAERVNREIVLEERLGSLASLAELVAHELSNQLTAIIGNIMLATEESPVDSAVRRRLNDALQATSRLSQLTADFQNYTGSVLLERKTFELNDLLGELLPPLLPLLPGTLDFAYRPALIPCHAAVAAQIVERALRELLEHSLSATSGQGRVRLTVGKHDRESEIGFDDVINAGLDDKPGVYIEVSHDGIGFDEETRKHLLDPYFKNSGAPVQDTEHRKLGFRFGLPSVLGAARFHRGLLLIKSNRGEETVIRLVFPEKRLG